MKKAPQISSEGHVMLYYEGGSQCGDEKDGVKYSAKIHLICSNVPYVSINYSYCACVRVHACVRVCVYVCLCVYVCVSVCIVCLCVCLCVSVCVSVCLWMWLCVCKAVFH